MGLAKSKIFKVLPAYVTPGVCIPSAGNHCTIEDRIRRFRVREDSEERNSKEDERAK